MSKYSYRLVTSGSSLSHSRGNWKEHKYVRKEGTGASAKYFYNVNATSEKRKKKDPSEMNSVELALYLKETNQRANEEYDVMSENWDKMMASGVSEGKFGARGEPFNLGRNNSWKYTSSQQKAINEYNKSQASYQEARDAADAANAEAKRRAANR